MTASVKTGRSHLTGRLITDHSSPAEDVRGANDEFSAPEAGTTTLDGGPSHLRSTSVSGLGAFASVGAALLCLAFSPQVNSDTFTPKFAILLLFAAVGLVPLARLVRDDTPLRWPARAAVAFLVVALVSALVSPAPNIGFFGLYLWGTGWLFWLGAAGAFAIGASLGPIDRQWVLGGFLVGAVGNALVAVFQIVTHPSGAMVLFDGTQADGVLGNPIHLEALLLGALALILGRTCRNPRRWGAVVLLLVVGIEFTFERLALVILALLVVYAFRSYGLRRGGIFTMLIGAGYAVAYLSGGSGLGSRVVSGTGETTFGTRLRIWQEGAHYMVQHPLLGAGPGQLRTALDSIASLSFVQHVLAGRILTDGHDIFVEVGVTTGVLGLAMFVVWMFGACATAARCGFLGFAVAMFAVELVEPLNIAILPLAFLGLGVATSVHREQLRTVEATALPLSGLLAPDDSRLSKRQVARTGQIVMAVSLCVAFFLAVTMVVGDVDMFRGTNSTAGRPYNLAAANDANRLLPYWPDSALEIAQVEAFNSTVSPARAKADLLDSLHWTSAALSRDRTDPHILDLLGGAESQLKMYASAKADFLTALSHCKWYPQAFQGLGLIAEAQHDWPMAVHWYSLALKAVEVRDPLGAAQLRGLLHRAERHTRSAGH
jgi:hypothetical protein